MEIGKHEKCNTEKFDKMKLIKGGLYGLVLLKLILFYVLMGTQSYFVPTLLISAFVLYIGFSLIKKKNVWAAVAIFGLISVFMFADAVFCGYFGRFLTIDMSGNAEVLGDIGECIKAVLKPYHFLLLLDFIAILVFEILVKKKNLEVPEFYTVPFKGALYAIAKILVVVLLICTLVLNPLGINAIQSISHSEMFSFHIKDVLGIKDDMDFSGVDIELEGNYYPDYDDPIFGIAEGRNLIVIQLESFMNFVVGKTYQGIEITPNLNKLIEDTDTIYFDNYYQQVGAGNTSDAEFATNNSYFGSNYSYTYALYYENYFKGLPFLLKERGYNTNVFHAYDGEFWNRNKAYPNLGFDNFVSQKDYKKGKNLGWGLCDVDWANQTAEMMKELDNPFYAVMITLSGHYPYNMGKENEVYKKDKDINEAFAKYLNAVHYTDKAIGAYLRALKKTGLYENSVIALYGDHQGFTITNTDYIDSFENFLGRDADFDDQMNIPLVIHVPGASNIMSEGKLISDKFQRTISISGGQTDFMPTICYLLGFEEVDTYFMGRNLLTAKEGFVAEKYYIASGSFIKDDLVFCMSSDYVFEHSKAWNRITRKSIPIDDLYDLALMAGGIVTESQDILYEDRIRFTVGGQDESSYHIPKRVVLNMDGSRFVPGQNKPKTSDPTLMPVEDAELHITTDGAIIDGDLGGSAPFEPVDGEILYNPDGTPVIDGGSDGGNTGDGDTTENGNTDGNNGSNENGSLGNEGNSNSGANEAQSGGESSQAPTPEWLGNV